MTQTFAPEKPSFVARMLAWVDRYLFHKAPGPGEDESGAEHPESPRRSLNNARAYLAHAGHVHTRACWEDPGPGHGKPFLICGMFQACCCRISEECDLLRERMPAGVVCGLDVTAAEAEGEMEDRRR